MDVHQVFLNQGNPKVLVYLCDVNNVVFIDLKGFINGKNDDPFVSVNLHVNVFKEDNVVVIKGICIEGNYLLNIVAVFVIKLLHNVFYKVGDDVYYNIMERSYKDHFILDIKQNRFYSIHVQNDVPDPSISTLVMVVL